MKAPVVALSGNTIFRGLTDMKHWGRMGTCFGGLGLIWRRVRGLNPQHVGHSTRPWDPKSRALPLMLTLRLVEVVGSQAHPQKRSAESNLCWPFFILMRIVP